LPSGESWFEELKNGSANNRLPWQFNAKELDETGLYYYGARYYNPRNGVWMSPDPILAQYVNGEVNGGAFRPANMGLFTYAWNNPVRLIDLDGLDPKDSAWIRIGKVALGVGYGVVQAVTPGGFVVDTAGTPSKDVDFLAGKGAANVAGGVVEILSGGTAAGAGVLGEIPSGGTSTLVVAGGVVAVAEGAANVATGLNAIAIAIKGGPGGSPAATGTSGGPRSGKSFTPKGKAEIDAENAARNGGTNVCENCSEPVVPGRKSEEGVTPPSNERQRDHIIPKSKGGDGDPSNGRVLCRSCNLEKKDKMP
jgi:RHS repeat-associated protein